MAKLYAALCVATVLVVSLPAIVGYDDAAAARGRRVPAVKSVREPDSLPPYLQWENHPGLRAMLRKARNNRVADATPR